MLQEFKKFAMRGNVMDMAVGVIIGGAFGKIVSSLVSDIMMPILGLITGGIDLTGLKIVMRAAVGDEPELALTYGAFLQNILDFLIIAFSIFLLVKAINRFRKKEEEKKEEEPAAPPPPSREEVLLAEIRDILKSQSQ